MANAGFPEDDTSTDQFTMEIEPTKQPIFIGVVFRKSSGEIRCASEEGQYILSKDTGKVIKTLIVESAKAAGEYVPETFIFESGEVFYNEKGIQEVRLSGRFISRTDVDGVVTFEKWISVQPPSLNISKDGHVALAAKDQGRPYIAAFSDSSYTHFSWNTKAQVQSELNSKEVDLFVLDLFVDEEQAEDEVNRVSFPFDEQEILDASELLKDLPADELANLLIPFPQEHDGRGVTITKSGEGRELVYCYQEEIVKSDLALAYAQSVRITADRVDELARAMRLSSDQAKAVLFLRHKQAQGIFVRENIEHTHEWSRKIIEDVFSRLIIQEVITKALAKWKHPWVTNDNPFQYLENKFVDEEKKTTKARLQMRPPGRPKGTRKGEESLEERERRIEWQKETIKNYIVKVNQQSLGRGLNSSEAEDSVKFNSVLLEMKKDIKKMSRSTLYEWIGESGTKFENIRDEVFRELSRNIIR